MGYIGLITHLLTIDPNFQRDIQVEAFKKTQGPGPPFSGHLKLQVGS